MPGLFPNLDIGLAWLVFVGLGAVGIVIGYYMWSGQAFGWLVAVSLAVADLVLRVLLPVVLGISWAVFTVFVALDVVMLFYLRKPSAIAFFGGQGVRDVLKKQRVEMRPQLKEIGFTLKLARKSSLSIIGAAIVLFYVFIAIFAPILAPPGDISQGGDPMIYGIMENP